MLTYIFYGLFILSCVILVLAVLLQPGKADAGAPFEEFKRSLVVGRTAVARDRGRAIAQMAIS